MASQAEILQFFEMMTERAKRGEFRFVALGTIDVPEGDIRVTIAGMAEQSEAEEVAEAITDGVTA